MPAHRLVVCWCWHKIIQRKPARDSAAATVDNPYQLIRPPAHRLQPGNSSHRVQARRHPTKDDILTVPGGLAAQQDAETGVGPGVHPARAMVVQARRLALQIPAIDGGQRAATRSCPQLSARNPAVLLDPVDGGPAVAPAVGARRISLPWGRGSTFAQILKMKKMKICRTRVFQKIVS